MAKHVGIVAVNAEGAAACYRQICREASRTLGEHTHPEISIHNLSFADYMNRVWQEDWEGAAQKLLGSANRLVEIGAELLVCPSSILLQSVQQIRETGPAPWICLDDAVAAAAKSEQYRTLGIVGSRYVLDSGSYTQALQRAGIELVIPDDAHANRLDRSIFVELMDGVVTDDARRAFREAIDHLADQGCEAAIVAAAAASGLVRPGETSIPTLDSGRLLASAALTASLDDPS